MKGLSDVRYLRSVILPSIIVFSLLVLASCSSGGQGEPPAPEPTPSPPSVPTPAPTPPPTLLPSQPTVEPVSSIFIPAKGGGITVRVVPRNESAIQFYSLDGNRWGFYGDQEALIGKDYQIELENTTSSRAKIVVGVDGLNIYRKKTLAGNPTDDIGSILSPGASRTLPGWQVSSERAERFVFSPSDWSDASGIRDAQIGTILVEVYYEKGSTDSSAMSMTIGTTSGETVGNEVGTVRFEAATARPAASALLIYGGSEDGQTQQKDQPQGSDLGLSDASSGLRIDSVGQGSSAERAGLMVGDVIVRADSISSPSVDDFKQLRSQKRAGDTVFLEVRRGDQSLRLKLRN
jgi:hypothetical protein